MLSSDLEDVSATFIILSTPWSFDAVTIPPEAAIPQIMRTISPPLRKRRHAEEYYTSLQPGPEMLIDLGVLSIGQLTSAERLQYLRNDRWIQASSVKTAEVTCGGCGNAIKLEQRHEFCPDLWVKHRNQCARVYEKWCQERELTAGMVYRENAASGSSVAPRPMKPLPAMALTRRRSLGHLNG